MIDKDKAVDCLKKINGMEKYLVSNPQKYYLESKMIYDNPAFLEWKTKVKDLLGKFRQTKLISETIATLDSFNGYSDEKLFPVLKAKIEIIINDIDDLIPNKRKDTSARLKIPVIHQRKNRAKADQIEKLLLKINADIAKEKQKSNRYYQESAEILSNVNRKKPEDSR